MDRMLLVFYFHVPSVYLIENQLVVVFFFSQTLKDSGLDDVFLIPS